VTELLPWAMLAALLALSGFFSASETALFSLDERLALRAGSRARRLLEKPSSLLVTILLGNLFVNVLFFALVPTVAGDASPLWSGASALLVLLLCGEILPKSLALRAPHLGSRLAAPPLTVAVRALRPVRRVVTLLLELCLRTLKESEHAEPGITSLALAQVLEKSAQEGLIAAGEADLLAEIVELGSLRVREIMTPRVDTVMLDLEETPEQRAATIQLAVKRRLTWLPVVAGDPDSVRGAAALRDLLANPERPLEQLVMPVMFVPEVAYALAMLGSMRDARVAEAVVVDEWGGTAGVVTLEDLFEEIVGELRVEGEELEKPVIPLGEGRFRVSGALSIHDWNDLLGRRIVPNEFETVGGYVLALLGRLPRAGDRVVLGGALTCEVREVRGRRVHTVDLCVVDEEGPPEVSA